MSKKEAHIPLSLLYACRSELHVTLQGCRLSNPPPECSTRGVAGHAGGLLHTRPCSTNSNKNAGHTTLPPHDFQTILQDAEREHLSKGETPPPSASPIRSENNNNNSKLNKGYTISSVDIPSFSAVPQILPAPVMTPRGMGFTQEYHSDSADSLLEVPNDHSLSLTSTASATKKKSRLQETKSMALLYTVLRGRRQAAASTAVKIAFIEQVRKKKPRHTDHVDGALSEDELNTTTLFTVNENARFARDGSLQYTDFRALPLTPTTLRKSSKASSPDDDTPLSMPASRRQLRVPPLDLSNLRGSHESVSFAPYTASMRSTDTVVTTERLLPPLKEEKRSRLQTVIDTEL
ncbi:hypothetical protein DPMN_174840 [Dreissena polymorpha]|uniref:Uncharacterized protein n=1 Tax=Dreissena polymorpha TaxID=45954 RepID=A0A9D4IIY8_DREPO|nr:hypothetical protein DPMN_174840 [Dreissena polymorpha]